MRHVAADHPVDNLREREPLHERPVEVVSAFEIAGVFRRGAEAPLRSCKGIGDIRHGGSDMSLAHHLASYAATFADMGSS